jgi:UDP-glucose 4-epimerase
MASSAAVYGSRHNNPIKENSSSIPFSPYGFHKRMAELLMESYAQNFGLKISVVRLFSVYGEGLSKQLLWDACTRLSDSRKTIEFGGTGSEMRDWIHVKDAVRLMWNARDYASEDFNILNGGTGISTTVRQITEKLCTEWGGVVIPTFSGKSRKGDPISLVADIGNLKSIGFEPKYNWEDGMKSYVKWFKGQHQ